MPSTRPSQPDGLLERALNPSAGASPAVVSLFLRLAPSQIEDISIAVSTSDENGLRESAHKLKGSCYAVGASKMAEICAALEPYPKDAARKVHLLRREFAAVVQALGRSVS
jgi:HPt (histidine-containing phosphotransfer) domain-containing protein